MTTAQYVLGFDEIVPILVDEGFELPQAEAMADVLDGCETSEMNLVRDVLRAMLEEE